MRPTRSASARAASCCPTTRRWSWPSSSACSKRCIPAASIWASAARRAPTRSPRRLCGARRTVCRPTTFRASSPSSWPSSTAPSPTGTRTSALPPCPREAMRPTCGCSARAATAPRPRACSGCRFRSRTTSVPPTRCRRCGCTAPRFGPPTTCSSRMRWSRSPSCAPRPTNRRAGWPRPRRCRSCACAPARPGLMPTPEEAAAYPYNELEREMIRARQADQVIGSPETVRRGLIELLERTQADELMLTTMVHGHADRLKSYELVAALRADCQISLASLKRRRLFRLAAGRSGPSGMASCRVAAGRARRAPRPGAVDEWMRAAWRGRQRGS